MQSGQTNARYSLFSPVSIYFLNTKLASSGCKLWHESYCTPSSLTGLDVVAVAASAMSLSLVQSYDSDEEPVKNGKHAPLHDSSDEEEDDKDLEEQGAREGAEPVYDATKEGSLAAVIGGRGGAPLGKISEGFLPSASDIFAEVKGPPAFLQTGVLAPKPAAPHASHILTPGNAQHRHEDGGRRAAALSGSSASASDRAAPGGALSKQGGAAPVPGGGPGSAGGVQGKRAIGVQLPPAEDANHLLRLCATCRIPKTASHAAGGMVCPQCKDRAPPAFAEQQAKRRGQTSAVKDKEKNKRMKGQSAHATWKSESEMHLRQQFD
eukprot:jgi/Mesen1/4748/ME000242S03920